MDILGYRNNLTIKLDLNNPLVFNLIIVGGIIFFMFFPRRKNMKSDLISMEHSEVIRGFSILIIIIHHLCRHAISDPSDLIIFYNLGHIGVGLFLILSGYGLSESYKKKGLNDFFYSKLLKIYTPFLLVNILYVTLNQQLLGQHLSFNDKILYAVGIINFDANFWYMKYLFLLYLSFYVVFRLSIKDNYKLIFLTIISLAFMASPFIPDSGRVNSLTFLFGVLISMKKEFIEVYISKMNMGKLSLTLLSLILISIPLIFLSEYTATMPHIAGKLNFGLALISAAGLFYIIRLPMQERISLLLFYVLAVSYFTTTDLIVTYSWAFALVLICPVVIFLLKNMNLNSHSIVFAFIGSISFELYLFHGAFMYSYDFILHKFPLEYSFFIYLIFIMILSVVFKKSTDGIQRFSYKLSTRVS